ncbi:hypothetical protein NQZ68_006094 [Dissostichus eleginoides]|nr:hypothetical protein NQZ68_006094 [Dissostichus eleginoides]
MSLRRLPAVKVGRIYNEASHFPLNKSFSSEQVQDLQVIWAFVPSTGHHRQVREAPNGAAVVPAAKG